MRKPLENGTIKMFFKVTGGKLRNGGDMDKDKRHRRSWNGKRGEIENSFSSMISAHFSFLRIKLVRIRLIFHDFFWLNS